MCALRALSQEGSSPRELRGESPSRQRKQRRLDRRSSGNSLELPILLAERLRNLYFRSFQDADELQGVDDGLSLKVIVGDHKRQRPAAHQHPERIESKGS